MDNNKDQDNMKAKELSGEEKLLHLMDNGKEEKVTAEEKLLHVIENKKRDAETASVKNTEKIDPGLSPEKNSETINDETIEESSSKISSFPSFLSNISFPSVDLANFDIKKISLASVNKILIVIAVILTIIFAFYILGEKQNVSERIAKLTSMKIEKNSMTISADKQNMPELNDYISETQKNNPFHLLPEDELKAAVAAVEKPLNLKLVGILWADNAQAIIEDLNSEKTFIVEDGDVVGDYKIMKITQLEVVLDENGEEKILK